MQSDNRAVMDLKREIAIRDEKLDRAQEKRDEYLQVLKDIDSALQDGIKVIRKGSPIHMGIKKLIKESGE